MVDRWSAEALEVVEFANPSPQADVVCFSLKQRATHDATMADLEARLRSTEGELVAAREDAANVCLHFSLFTHLVHKMLNQHTDAQTYSAKHRRRSTHAARTSTNDVGVV